MIPSEFYYLTFLFAWLIGAVLRAFYQKFLDGYVPVANIVYSLFWPIESLNFAIQTACVLIGAIIEKTILDKVKH